MVELLSAFAEDFSAIGRWKWFTVFGPALVFAAVTLSRALGLNSIAYLLVLVMAAIAALVGGVQLLNTGCRPFWEHWDTDVGARPLLVAEGLLGLSLVGLGIYGLRAEEPATWVLTVGFLPPGVAYWFIEYAIAEKISEAGKKPGRWHMSQWRPLRFLRSDASVGPGAESTRRTPQGRVVARLLGPEVVVSRNAPSTPSLFDQEALPVDSAQERTGSNGARGGEIGELRVWMSFALMIVFAVCASVAAGEEIGAKLEMHRRDQSGARGMATSVTKTRSITTTNRTTTRSSRTVPLGSTKATTRRDWSKSESELEWRDLCDAEPGIGAPAWARRALYDAYLGINGPGAGEAGCTGQVFSIGNSFVYQEGRNPATDELMSIAVVSKTAPAAIFLVPAAPLVLSMIRKFGPLGGSVRFDVLNGDLQLVYVSAGTICLVRPQKVRSGGRPEPLRNLPPAVCAAWYAAMRELGQWLWIERTSVAGNGVVTYVLLRSVIKKTRRGVIRYDPSNGEAFRQVAPTWLRTVAVGERIGVAAFQALAVNAEH
jgi:hypothetical protein